MQKGRTSKLILSFLCAVLFIACDLFYSPPGVLESSRQAGTYLQPIAITLSSNHSKAIHYTTDGSLPTLDSPRYTTPITLTKTTQVQAIAIDSNDKVMQRKSWNYIVRGTPHFSPTLSVAEQRIYHVSDQYEYSADDGNTWQACTGFSQSLPELSVGNKVHVRHKVVQDDNYYLGEVLGLSGPDLVAGNCYVAHARRGENEIDDFSGLIFDANFSDGNATIAIPTITNAGNATFTGSAIIDFYASSDPFITEEDLRFLSMETINFTLEPNQTYGASQDGSWPTDVIWLLGLIKTVDKVPQLLYQVITLEGFQYIGYHLRTEESELLSQNNWTASQHVDSVFFAESNTTTSEGAFKIVNSYGVGETWEHIPDGAYYLPFDAAVALKLRINYSFNTFETVYEPFLFASFTLSHPNRETCLISIGVGEPEHPLMVKRLQSISDIANDDPVLAGGPNPFPNTKMVMDISEFAPYIATNDIFIRIDNRLGAEIATLSSFSVELYDDYSLDPADAAQILDFPLEGSSPTVAARENRTFLISTSRDLEQDSLPLLRTQSRSRSSSQSLPAQRPLTEEEIQSILSLQAPASRSRSQSNPSSGGLVPPTESELRSMRTIDVGARFYPGTLPLEVDWSQSPYFPPIGNQGQKGSCAAFTNAYYIHTFNEAREHGWDLSGAEWIDSTTGSGYPSVAYQDKIMSPDFSYHLVSQAPGASIAALQSVLNRIGSSTWKTTGYDEVDDTRPYTYPWPTEEAFREAALYRGRRSDGSYFEENSGGLIVLDDPAKIDIIQQLLASGYCLATGIHAQSFFYNDPGEQWMNEEDVVDLTGVSEDDINYFRQNINHAQTIVGYKTGLL